MISWLLGSLFSITLQYFLKWSAHETITISCLFAIFLNTAQIARSQK
jgi:hypothetical protein